MKSKLSLLIFFLLAAALTACRSATRATPTEFPFATSTPLPAASPTSPPLMFTPEPPTPTPEVFIPLTQAVPETSTFSLPEACQKAGSMTYANRANGYCFAYPAEFIWSLDAGISISSGPLDASPEPLIVSVGILAQPAGGLTLDSAVEAFLQEYVGANPPWVIPNTAVSIGGETGRLLDPLPGRLSSRAVIVLHNQVVYRLIFYPSPVNSDGSLNAQPGDPAYDNFTALYEAVMSSFSFLDGPGSILAVPLKCLDSDQPFSFDPATGECAAMPAPQPTSSPSPTPETPPTPGTPATPDPNQGLGSFLFEDLFDGSSGWLWGFSEEGVVSFSIDNGSVLARLEAANKGWRISLGPDAFTASDQQVQLTARSEACGERDEWGLLFRGALNSNTKFNGYVFKLNCDGQASVDRLAGNKATPLLGWTPVPGVQAGAGRDNTLLVWAGQSELRFYVNGVYIGTVNDSTYPSGEYGLYVNGRDSSSARFRFTSLRVFGVAP